MKITYKICITSLLAMLVSTASLRADELKGVVSDLQQRPLSGYVVKNTNSQMEVITNKRGEFTLEAQAGDAIDFIINGVVMEQMVAPIDENWEIKVAVDPYKAVVKSAASASKIDRYRTSAAVDVATSEDLENYSGYSSANTIIGKLASLSTVVSSGLIDDDYASLIVRGKATDTGNTPLVLIDGYESSLSMLSNIEIESVVVLKDAVALVPYGLRGANGVVLVTTKTGVAGEPQFKVNVEYGVSMPQFESYVGAADYATLVNEARANDGLSPLYSNEQLSLQGSDQYLYPDVDWASEMYKSMSTYTNASVEMTGGSNTVRYYTMVDFKSYDGLYNHTDYNNNYDLQNDMNRINFRSNLSMDITKTLQMNVRLGGRLDNSTDLQYGTDSYYDLLMSTPSNRYAIFNEDGSYNGDAQNLINPYAHLVERGFNDYHERAFDANVDLNLDLGFITKGLSVSGAISFASEAIVTEAYTGGTYAVYEPTTIWALNDTNTAYVETLSYNKFGNDTEVAFGSESAVQDRTSTYRLALDYAREWDKHSVVSTLMAERSEQDYQSWAEPFKYVNLALTANYGYANKYFADVALSYAGSNAFEKGNNMGLLPAAGLSWIVSEEDFLKGNDVINFLKVRASAGITGNATSSRFLYLYNYASDGTYYFGQTATSTTGLSQSAIMDPYFTWEKSYMYNIGIDMRMLQKRMYLSVDVFRELRVDILDDYSDFVSSTVVYPSLYDCYGQVLNQGVDFTLGYKDSYSSGFGFGIAVNGGFSKNKVLQQYELASTPTSGIGYPVDAVFGYEAIGFYSSEDDIANNPSTLGQVQVGDIMYKDIDSNGYIDEYDQTYLGSVFPTFNFGLNLNLSYKGIYVDAWFDGMAGGYKNVISNVIYNPLNGTDGNISSYAADNYWTAERGDSATLPRLSYDYNQHNSQTNSLYMLDSSFMRLRSAEVGYNLPYTVVKRLGLSSAKIYLRGHNLLVVDSMGGLDPEVSSGFPLTKSYFVGLNVGF